MCACERVGPAGRVGGYAFVECECCRFVFAPEVTSRSTGGAYTSVYVSPEGQAPTSGWSVDDGFLRPAFALAPTRRPLRILDFGAGESLADDLLRQRGHRVIGLDLAPPRIPHPDRWTGDLLGMRLPSDDFDLLFSFQVFEHLPEPRPILEELLRIARPHAPVLLHTDMEMPEREPGFEQWWYVMPPDHCSFYRHRTFEVFVDGTPHRLAWADDKRVVLLRGG